MGMAEHFRAIRTCSYLIYSGFILGVRRTIPVEFHDLLGVKFYFALLLELTYPFIEPLFHSSIVLLINKAVWRRSFQGKARWIKALPYVLAGVTLTILCWAQFSSEKAILLLLTFLACLAGAILILGTSGVAFLKEVPNTKNPEFMDDKLLWPPKFSEWRPVVHAGVFTAGWVSWIIGLFAIALTVTDPVVISIGQTESYTAQIVSELNNGFLLRGADQCIDCIWFLSSEGQLQVHSTPSLD